MDDQISDAQAAAERLALVVSSYYNQLVREQVPPDQAVMLAYKFQEHMMNLSYFAPQPDDDDAAASTNKS